MSSYCTTTRTQCVLFFKLKSGLNYRLINIIIHQTHYEKSDWLRAFNQFTIACELDMINVIAADITYLSCQVQRLPGY